MDQKLNLLENPKIVCKNWAEWIEKEEDFIEIIELTTRKIICVHFIRTYDRNDSLNRYVDNPLNIGATESGIIYVLYRYLLDELTRFTNNEIWSEKIADNITISLSSLFKSFDLVEGFLYNNLKHDEVMRIIASNVSSQLQSYFETYDIVKILN